MYGHGAGMNGWGYAVLVLAALVLVGLVVAGVSALARRPGAEQILQERFVRGEVDGDEFRSRMDELHADSKQ